MEGHVFGLFLGEVEAFRNGSPQVLDQVEMVLELRFTFLEQSFGLVSVMAAVSVDVRAVEVRDEGVDGDLLEASRHCFVP